MPRRHHGRKPRLAAHKTTVNATESAAPTKVIILIAANVVNSHSGDHEGAVDRLGRFHLRRHIKVEIKYSQERQRKLPRRRARDSMTFTTRTSEPFERENTVRVVHSVRTGAQKHAHRRTWHHSLQASRRALRQQET